MSSSQNPLGERGRVLEEEYFRKQQKEQLDALKSSLQKDIADKQDELKNHSEVLEQHQKRLANIEERAAKK
ncbi:unnamed protein product [Caenorhabditis angaria]|uniref:ATPase inhibitor, mitochondrial n=1 Tax=Caenorhabditis angaria TaxID=860376 RepID=A0A9P1J3H6_9PELO|nr:unnamed protein product [Caenorhabditis angaria]